LILANVDHRDILNREIFPGIQGGPLMHVIAAKAVAFKEALTEAFRVYQTDTVRNAKTLAGHLMAADVNLVSGGTDNHMMLADVRNFNTTGRDAEAALERAGITVNKNAVPFDEHGPLITSGIRIGTPTLTSRRMGEPEMKTVAELIVNVLKNPKDDGLIEKTGKKVLDLCNEFPIYRDLDDLLGITEA